MGSDGDGAIDEHPDVVAAAAGDDVALTRLLLRHHQVIRAIVERGSRFSGGMDADDVVQEAMVDIFKSVASLTIRTQAGFLAWATRVVRNRVAQVHRRNLAQRRGGGERHLADGQDLIDGLFRHSRSPRSWLANKELLGLLPLWVDSLEEPARRVIRMRFVDGRDYQTIALELRTTPQAVRMMVMRSLRQLRAMAIEPGEESL